MKMVKKLVVLMLFMFAFAGCGQKSDVDIKEAFLTTYLTSNYENRYTNYLENVAGYTTPAVAEQRRAADLDAIYDCVKDFLDEGAFKTFVYNNKIFNYDRIAWEYQVEIVPSDYSFEEHSRHVEPITHDELITYEYTVTLNVDGAVLEDILSGQITVKESSRREYITDMYERPSALYEWLETEYGTSS